MLESFDWRSFFAWPGDASVWSVLNSPILVTFLAALIGWRLNRRVNDAEAKADAANYSFRAEQAELALADDDEQPQPEIVGERELEQTAPRGTEPASDFRSQAGALYEQAEVFLDGVLRKADGRHRRTYKNLKGAGISALATAMLERGDLNPSQYQGAIELAHEWNQYRRGKASRKIVPKATCDKMRRSLAKLRDE